MSEVSAEMPRYRSLYRVGRTADGLRWWQPGWEIPADVTDLRPATNAEVELMDRIVSHPNPPVAWGTKLAAMMEAACHDHPSGLAQTKAALETP